MALWHGSGAVRASVCFEMERGCVDSFFQPFLFFFWFFFFSFRPWFCLAGFFSVLFGSPFFFVTGRRRILIGSGEEKKDDGALAWRMLVEGGGMEGGEGERGLGFWDHRGFTALRRAGLATGLLRSVSGE